MLVVSVCLVNNIFPSAKTPCLCRTRLYVCFYIQTDHNIAHPEYKVNRTPDDTVIFFAEKQLLRFAFSLEEADLALEDRNHRLHSGGKSLANPAGHGLLVVEHIADRGVPGDAEFAVDVDLANSVCDRLRNLVVRSSAAAVKHEGNIAGFADLGKSADLKLGSGVVDAVSGSDGNCKSVCSGQLNEFCRFGGIGEDGFAVGVFAAFSAAAVTDFTGGNVAVFGILIFNGFSIALATNNTYDRLLALGIIMKVAVQTLLNIAVVTNTIPNTGISLPFFSYGGSSLLMLFFEMGIILSISAKGKKRAKEV